MPASVSAFLLISSTRNDADEEPIVSTVNDKGLVIIKTGQEEVKEDGKRQVCYEHEKEAEMQGALSFTKCVP
jgi:hypothetical protein